MSSAGIASKVASGDLCRSCGHLCEELVSINEEVEEKLSLSTTFRKLSAMMAECVDVNVSALDLASNQRALCRTRFPTL